MTNIDHVNADWNLSSEKNPIFFVIWSPSDSSTKHLKMSLFVGYEMLKLAKRSIRIAVFFYVISKKCVLFKNEEPGLFSCLILETGLCLVFLYRVETFHFLHVIRETSRLV